MDLAKFAFVCLSGLPLFAGCGSKIATKAADNDFATLRTKPAVLDHVPAASEDAVAIRQVLLDSGFFDGARVIVVEPSSWEQPPRTDQIDMRWQPAAKGLESD